MSALRLTKLFGPVEFFEKIEKRIRNGFLLDCAIQGFQFRGDPGVRVAGAGARPAGHIGTPLIFRVVTHRQLHSSPATAIARLRRLRASY
jgi:hypothetical protein